jgi:predicted MFS family arabinose efflux permease
MLTGDIMGGRFLPAQARTWLVEPLRFLLAVPYVVFFLHPALAPAAVLGFLASAGYAASLPLQERLISHTGAEVRGQVLGLNSTGVTAMQGVGAVLAGLLTQRLHGGPAAAATAIGVMGCASLAITVALIPGLRRTRPRRGRYGSGTAPAVGGPTTARRSPRTAAGSSCRTPSTRPWRAPRPP